jgi:hypothetical protein
LFVCCVCVVCCQVEVSATRWSLVQRSPTDCGASLCVIKKPRRWKGHSPRWAAEAEKIIIIIIISSKKQFLLVERETFESSYFTLLEICTWWSGSANPSFHSAVSPRCPSQEAVYIMCVILQVEPTRLISWTVFLHILIHPKLYQLALRAVTERILSKIRFDKET